MLGLLREVPVHQAAGGAEPCRRWLLHVELFFLWQQMKRAASTAGVAPSGSQSSYSCGSPGELAGVKWTHDVLGIRGRPETRCKHLAVQFVKCFSSFRNRGSILKLFTEWFVKTCTNVPVLAWLQELVQAAANELTGVIVRPDGVPHPYTQLLLGFESRALCFHCWAREIDVTGRSK